MVLVRLGGTFMRPVGLGQRELQGAEGGQGCIDPSLPQLCRGKTRHGGGSSSRSPR
jgi:hypothetical protein